MVTTDAPVFSDPRYRADPYAVFAEVRRDRPVYPTRLPSGEEVLLVTRFVDVEAGLKDARLVKNITNARDRRPGLLARLGFLPSYSSSNMLRADPPEHTRLRALAHQAFTPRLVNQMRDHIQTLADQLIDAVEPAGRMDLIANFALPLPITVICELLGVPRQDEKKFRRWSNALIDSGALSSEKIPTVPQVFLMLRYVRRLVRRRRAHPLGGDDLIGQLIAARENGQQLADRELVSTIILLLIAGHETTVNLIANGMLALLLNPEQLRRLRDEPTLIRPAVEELLRYVNPVQMVNRYAREDLDIGEVRVARGSHVVLIVAAGNHDPAFVDQPEHLDVTRAVRQHVAFGQGIHYCLGAPLARLEGEIAFATLLRRLPNLRLGVPVHQLEWRSSIELRGLRSLPVQF
ncbi:MAG: cytochrome P450 [Chloroflexi bacterium]|nr:cytochrome P450 [Chloroflexota bacterium]